MASLRSNLTRTLLSAFLVIGSLAMAAAYRNARQEVDEMFDFEIKAVALSVDSADVKVEEHAMPDDDILVQIWSDTGALEYTSGPDSSIPRAPAVGYSWIQATTGAYRTYVREADASRIQVAQALASRRELAVEYCLRLLAPLLLMVPVMAIAIWWLIGRSLLPVGRLGTELAARTDGVLDPVDRAELPDELLPLVTGFNQLLEKLQGVFEAQRSLVADAAHELRTPLAVVQIQAQTLQRLPGSPHSALALRDLLQGVGRATRVVQQLLSLARHDCAGPAPACGRVDLTDLMRSTLAELLPLGVVKHIDLSFDCDRVVHYDGDGGALQALFSNLVDNAIKYTPVNGRIRVSLRADDHCARLQVSDTGPGIAPEYRGLVLDRFYRIPGSAGVGSGLGLAIATAVVKRHRGQLLLTETAGGGLTVDVSLP